jgi:hypothetical protein
MSATQAVAECGLDGRSTTSRFFAEWSPSRIQTASFGSVFTARELGLKATERVDLFVIDPDNRFVLLIENKAGTAHSQKPARRLPSQLARGRGQQSPFEGLQQSTLRWIGIS